jgi:hypothetical protein
MTRRRGTSLIEVLVTIGILGIGLTSVIALFPMAAITLGQALRDDRTATSAGTADGFIRDIHHRNCPPEPTAGQEYYFAAMDGTGYGLPPVNPNEPSYPVFIDPMGYYVRGGVVGDGGATSIPRVNLKMIQDAANQGANGSSLALRLCSQMDGLSYTDDGIVQPGANMRELRYNWLWVVQRPVNRDRYTATLKIVVFDRRVHLYSPPGMEAVYNVGFTPGLTTISVPSTADVKKGSWVMDGTIGADLTNQPIRHANFYRVTSVTDLGTGTYTLELHTPITRVDGGTGSYNGRLLVMPAVADVYERTSLTAP